MIKIYKKGKMEITFKENIDGYTKAIVDEKTFDVIAIDGDFVTRLELGQKVLINNRNYCINAFSKPFINDRGQKIINVCDIENYPKVKRFKTFGITVKPSDIFITETILR